jgi:hypothetical protein
MMRSSFLLMNLMKLIRNDVFFFQRDISIYLLSFIKKYETIGGDYVMIFQDWIDFQF